MFTVSFVQWSPANREIREIEQRFQRRFSQLRLHLALTRFVLISIEVFGLVLEQFCLSEGRSV